MKKLFSLFAAVLFAGSMMAEQATIAKGTTNSYDDNTINGKATVKMGKSGAGGNMTITVGAGATSLSFYSAAWNNEGASVTITAPEGVTIAPDSYTVVATSELAGSSKSFTVANEENYKFTFALTGVTAETTFTLTSVKRCFVWDATYATGDTPADPVVEYYLVGTMNEWTPATGYKFAANGANAGEYMLKTTFAANDQFKVRKVIDGEADAWYPDGTDNNYVINDAGRYNVYFRPDGQGGEGWHQGCIYAARILPKTCAEVYSMAKDDEVLLNNVTVTFANGKNVWVKDATGSMLVYLPANGSFVAGDVLSGVEGVVDIYNGIYEVKLNAAQVEAITTTAGEAPAPEELAAVATTDMNKYIVLKNLAVEGEFVEGTASNITLTLSDESTIVLRSNFKNAYAFDAAKTYNITAVVTIYQSNPQLYFISAEEYVAPVEPAEPQLNIMAYGLRASEVADGKVTISYSLNAKATAVEIQLLDAEGAVAETFAAPATGLAKGEHSVEIDLADVEAGSYHWAVKASAQVNNITVPTVVATAGTGSSMSRSVAIDNHYDSPYYGNVYAVHGLGVGMYGFDASLEPLFDGEAVATNGWNAPSSSSPCDATVGEDGLVYITDWADTKPNVRIFDPATPNADAKNVFGGTSKGTSGLMVNEAGDTIHGSMRYCYPMGSGENTVLYTVDEDYKLGGVTHVFTYNIGTAATPWEAKPSGEGFTHAMTDGKWAGTVSNIAFVPSKVEGGWWIAQHRYDDGSAVPALMHITPEGLNYNSTGEFANNTVGHNNQATFAINNAQDILVTLTTNGVFSLLVWDITWNGDVPTVTNKYTLSSGFSGATLGVGLDDAGNIYATGPNKPVTVWALPKADNSCVTPANSASLIVIHGTGTAVENMYVLKAEKVIRNGQVLIIKDGKTYNMMGQIVE